LLLCSTDPDFTPCSRNKSIVAIFPEVGQAKVLDGVVVSAALANVRHASKFASSMDAKSEEDLFIFRVR
jgi:hypothetical protein